MCISGGSIHAIFSSCSKVDKIREFIRSVYVDRKYAGGRTSEKPPRDMQVVSWIKIAILDDILVVWIHENISENIDIVGKQKMMKNFFQM